MTATRRNALQLALASLAGLGLGAAPDAALAQRRPRGAAPALPPPPAELVALAGSCVMSGFYGRSLPLELRSLLARGALGGLLIGRGNFSSAEGLRALCAALRAMAPPDAQPLLAADQEGGPVAHLSPPLVNVPSMTVLGELDDAELTHRVGASLGAELRAVGINMDLAPVLDVRTSPRNTVVLNRVFGREPEKVARHGLALIDGLSSAGVLACAKHFPGHGDTTVDSHAGLPRVSHDLARLDAVELVPFRACARAVPSVMLAHVVYAGVDPQRPASLSQRVIEGVLRERLGYDGVAVTDDLQMAAIQRSMPVVQAAELAVRSGVDLVLIAHTSTLAAAVVRHLARRAEGDAALRGRLEQASQRLRRMKRTFAAALPPNPFIASSATISAEVQRRVAERGASARARRPQRDPTRAR